MFKLKFLSYFLLFLLFFTFISAEVNIVQASTFDRALAGISSFTDNYSFTFKGMFLIPNEDIAIETDFGIMLEIMNQKSVNANNKFLTQFTITPHSVQAGLRRYVGINFDYAPDLIDIKSLYIEGNIARKGFPNFLANTYGVYLGKTFSNVLNLDIALGYEIWPGLENNDSSNGSAFYRISLGKRF